MESRRTPNHPKPVGNQQSTTSQSKFARPKSNRKQDPNATLSGFKGHNASVIGSSRPLHHKVRQNLNITLSGAAFPNIKSNIGPSANDNEQGYDLAYNDHLQALMKRQLVKKTLEQHEKQLNDQILIQSEHMHKLENTFKDISNKIDDLKEQSNIVELLQMLKYGVSEIEDLCLRYNTYNRLNDLKTILTEESNLVGVRNIKPISSQAEYDKLMVTLANLKRVMEKIIKGNTNFKEVKELSSHIKSFNELQNKMTTTIQKLINSNKKAAGLVLSQSSDLFAQQGGYF